MPLASIIILFLYFILSVLKSDSFNLISFSLLSVGSQTHGGSAENTCYYPFDGPGKVLAHAFFPSNGRCHFDEDERFTDGTSSGINLLWVATHEFGHALGIHHSDVRNAVMYPYYTGYVPGFSLQQDDIDAIQSLYGKLEHNRIWRQGGEIYKAPFSNTFQLKLFMQSTAI